AKIMAPREIAATRPATPKILLRSSIGCPPCQPAPVATRQLDHYGAIRTKISSFPRVSIAPLLVPCRCRITPALFSSHKCLSPEVLKPALPVLCVYLPGKSATLASLQTGPDALISSTPPPRPATVPSTLNG